MDIDPPISMRAATRQLADARALVEQAVMFRGDRRCDYFIGAADLL